MTNVNEINFGLTVIKSKDSDYSYLEPRLNNLFSNEEVIISITEKSIMVKGDLLEFLNRNGVKCTSVRILSKDNKFEVGDILKVIVVPAYIINGKMFFDSKKIVIKEKSKYSVDFDPRALEMLNNIS